MACSYRFCKIIIAQYGNKYKSYTGINAQKNYDEFRQNSTNERGKMLFFLWPSFWNLDVEGLFWVCVLNFYWNFRYWRRKVSLCSKKITEIPWNISTLFHLKKNIPFLGFEKNVPKEKFDTVRHLSTQFAPENLEHKLHFCILYLNQRLNFRIESQFWA